MSLIASFIQFLALLEEEKNVIVIKKNTTYTKNKKTSTTKIKFKKKWFIENFKNIYEKNTDVFKSLELEYESPDIFYKKHLAFKKKDENFNEVLFTFINQLYIDWTVPRQAVII